jgi:hypothetical protein
MKYQALQKCVTLKLARSKNDNRYSTSCWTKVISDGPESTNPFRRNGKRCKN